MILIDESRRDTLSEVLVDVLVCPKDHADLRLEGNELVCVRCGTRYPIEDGIPNMLIDRN
jgi:uncharacterized protein YbaR (Trm112 family)